MCMLYRRQRREDWRVEPLAVDHRLWEIVQLKPLVGASLRLGVPDDQPAAGEQRAVKALDQLMGGGFVEVDRDISAQDQILGVGAIQDGREAWLGQVEAREGDHLANGWVQAPALLLG